MSLYPDIDSIDENLFEDAENENVLYPNLNIFKQMIRDEEEKLKDNNLTLNLNQTRQNHSKIKQFRQQIGNIFRQNFILCS